MFWQFLDFCRKRLIYDVLIPNCGIISKYTAATARITPRIFRINPYPAICVIRMRPVPNTIALGGVPIGSMNAQLADTVAGIINNRGSTPKATEAAAKRTGGGGAAR